MGDPLWHYKVLGLHCDGTNGSTTFTDVKGKTVTANGNAQISTAQYPALTGKTSSGYLDGAGDYLSIPTSSDFNFGSGDFRINGAFMSFDLSGVRTLVSRWGDGATANRQLALWVIGSTDIQVSISTNGTSQTNAIVASSLSLSTGVWYPYSLIRNGPDLKFFLGTSQVGSTYNISTDALYSPSSDLIVGATISGTSLYHLYGHFSEIEVYKGVGGTFSVPSAPFQDEYVSVSGTTKDSSGALASRLVRAYRRDTGALVSSVLSNGVTGAYKVIAPNSGTPTPVNLTVVCLDATADPPGSPTENALIYDNITPI